MVSSWVDSDWEQTFCSKKQQQLGIFDHEHIKPENNEYDDESLPRIAVDIDR